VSHAQIRDLHAETREGGGGGRLLREKDVRLEERQQAKAGPGTVVMQRVKVYRLNSDGLWDDKGTGHVSVEYLEVRAARSFTRVSSVSFLMQLSA
jgi:hypothetical protein